MASLLPPSTTPLERALSAVLAAAVNLDVPIRHLWNPETCPVALLPWLAWTVAVDQWDDNWPESVKRATIAGQAARHRKRGTPWAIKNALESRGYPECEIIEHRQFLNEWIEAGGELLDGVGTLDGTGDLSAPGGQFRFATTSWAEYALRLNAADAPTTSEMLRQIAALCEAYAPARSHLVAILLFSLIEFDSSIRLVGFSAHGRVVLDGCRRFTVPSFDTLDGCDLIGGETLLDTLDGVGTLDGHDRLVPERYTGEPLDGGQLDIVTRRIRSRSGMTAHGGNYLEPPETLNAIDLLDGRYTIAGETLDGTGLLDGGDLRYPTLADHEDTLDGTSNLGEVAGPDTIWFRGLVRIRRGSTVIQEPL